METNLIGCTCKVEIAMEPKPNHFREGEIVAVYLHAAVAGVCSVNRLMILLLSKAGCLSEHPIRNVSEVEHPVEIRIVQNIDTSNITKDEMLTTIDRGSRWAIGDKKGEGFKHGPFLTIMTALDVQGEIGDYIWQLREDGTNVPVYVWKEEDKNGDKAMWVGCLGLDNV